MPLSQVWLCGRGEQDGTLTVTPGDAEPIWPMPRAGQLWRSPIPPSSGTVTGFLNTDTLASVHQRHAELRLHRDARQVPVGSYAITGSGLSATNYVFVQAASNASALTVTSGAIGSRAPRRC